MNKRNLWPPLSAYHETALGKENIPKWEDNSYLICHEKWSPLPENDGTRNQAEWDFEDDDSELEFGDEDQAAFEAMSGRMTLAEDDTSTQTAEEREINKRLYQDLPYSDSIRFLKIDPGVGDNPIICSLQLARLDSLSITYEALSYVWGNTWDVEMDIACNGEVKRIRCNLYDALQRIRHPEQSRVIWVDAICIDQSNKQEREHQVQLMGSIYGKAQTVLIWLGRDTRNQAEPAFSVLCSVIKEWQNGDLNAEKPSYSIFGRLTEPSDLERPPPDSELWEAVSQLFNCRWFWRVWVIQEVALAGSASVLWGKGEIQWRWIGLAAAIIRTNDYQIHARHTLAGMYNAYFMYRLSTREDDGNPLRGAAFLDLLRLTRQFEVTDPRDRIYGLLGLLDLGNDQDREILSIRPNYTLPADEIYHRIGMSIVDSSKSLDLLSSVQYHSDHFQSSGWPHPSWIPQWDTVFTSTLASWDINDNFSASKGFPLQRKDLEAKFPKRLVVSSLVVGEVVKCFTTLLIGLGLDLSPLFHPRFKAYIQSEFGLSLLCKVLTAGRSWYGSLAEENSSQLADFAAYVVDFLKGSIYPESNWFGNRRMVSDQADQHQKLMKELMNSSWLHKLADNGDRDRFVEAATRVCNSRLLFITSTGFLGLGSSIVAEGDVLCVLSGGHLPFVLRPFGKRYNLVGECYVEGLMQGEIVEAAVNNRAIENPISGKVGNPDWRREAPKPKWIEIW
jgi:hypothetical protein